MLFTTFLAKLQDFLCALRGPVTGSCSHRKLDDLGDFRQFISSYSESIAATAADYTRVVFEYLRHRLDYTLDVVQLGKLNPNQGYDYEVQISVSSQRNGLVRVMEHGLGLYR